jgi:uncharacterized protein (DUF58 family)
VLKSLLRTARPVRAVAVLDRRHVYILPTRQGVLFAVVLVCMLIGSINYALSLGFVLTFLLAGLAVIGMVHTWRNLAGLHVEAGKTEPVFAGEIAHLQLLARDVDGHARHAIEAGLTQDDTQFFDVPAQASAEFSLFMLAPRRGWLVPGRITLATEFPLGLFRAASYVALDARCLVYPRPAETDGLPLPAGQQGAVGLLDAASGEDDFSGLRHYRHGDPLRRIDWKSSAREQGLFTKEFQGASSATLWLDWAICEGDTEIRLSRLTRWVLDAQADGVRYGLRLPGSEIAPDRGESHAQHCLEALALFGIPA